MIFGSSEEERRKTFELALSEMPAAAADVAEKWSYFTDTLKFKDDVPLHEQVRAFSIPLADFFRTKYLAISKTDPLVYFGSMLIGIYLAKTHPIPKVLGVARYAERELGIAGVEQLVKNFVDSTPNR